MTLFLHLEISQDVCCLIFPLAQIDLRVLLPPYKDLSLWMQVLSFITCLLSGVALLSAGCDACLTVLQSEPLELKLLARIPIGLTRTYKVNLTPTTG